MSRATTTTTATAATTIGVIIIIIIGARKNIIFEPPLENCATRWTVSGIREKISIFALQIFCLVFVSFTGFFFFFCGFAAAVTVAAVVVVCLF